MPISENLAKTYFGQKVSKKVDSGHWKRALQELDARGVSPVEVQGLIEEWYATNHDFLPTAPTIARNLAVLQDSRRKSDKY